MNQMSFKNVFCKILFSEKQREKMTSLKDVNSAYELFCKNGYSKSLDEFKVEMNNFLSSADGQKIMNNDFDELSDEMLEMVAGGGVNKKRVATMLASGAMALSMITGSMVSVSAAPSNGPGPDAATEQAIKQAFSEMNNHNNRIEILKQKKKKLEEERDNKIKKLEEEVKVLEKQRDDYPRDKRYSLEFKDIVKKLGAKNEEKAKARYNYMMAIDKIHSEIKKEESKKFQEEMKKETEKAQKAIEGRNKSSEEGNNDLLNLTFGSPNNDNDGEEMLQQTGKFGTNSSGNKEEQNKAEAELKQAEAKAKEAHDKYKKSGDKYYKACDKAEQLFIKYNEIADNSTKAYNKAISEFVESKPTVKKAREKCQKLKLEVDKAAIEKDKLALEHKKAFDELAKAQAKYNKEKIEINQKALNTAVAKEGALKEKVLQVSVKLEELAAKYQEALKSLNEAEVNVGQLFHKRNTPESMLQEARDKYEEANAEVNQALDEYLKAEDTWKKLDDKYKEALLKYREALAKSQEEKDSAIAQRLLKFVSSLDTVGTWLNKANETYINELKGQQDKKADELKDRQDKEIKIKAAKVKALTKISNHNSQKDITIDQFESLLAGNQTHNDYKTKDGKTVKINNTCGIHMMTTMKNIYDFMNGNQTQPVIGFQNVIDNYLKHCGNQGKQKLFQPGGNGELGQTFGSNDLKPFLEKNNIGMYKLEFTDDVALTGYDKDEDKKNIDEHSQKFKNNIKGFLTSYMQGKNFAPIGQVFGNHWTLLAKLNDKGDKILRLDSAPNKAEWLTLDDVVNRFVTDLELNDNNNVKNCVFSCEMPIFKQNGSFKNITINDAASSLTPEKQQEIIKKIG